MNSFSGVSPPPAPMDGILKKQPRPYHIFLHRQGEGRAGNGLSPELYKLFIQCKQKTLKIKLIKKIIGYFLKRIAEIMTPHTTHTAASVVSGEIGEYVVFFTTGTVVSGSTPVTGTLVATCVGS
jgi:hypothetical protein